MLPTGIQGKYLPQELGFGSGMTCWRRLAAWNDAGVWDQLHLVLPKKLDRSRAATDSSHVRAARRDRLCTSCAQGVLTAVVIDERFHSTGLGTRAEATSGTRTADLLQ